MIKLITALFTALFMMLPTSPVRTALEGMDIDPDILGYLNWFVPFDIARDITVAWLLCIVAYYGFTTIKKFVDLIIENFIG